MRKPAVFVILVLASLFVLGCSAPAVTLPDAMPGQPYNYALVTSTRPLPNVGVPPYKCSVTEDSVLPGTLQFEGCTLTGNAPILLPTSTDGTYNFRFIVTDSTGKKSGPFEANLRVTRGSPELTPPQLDLEIGQPYIFNFCENPTALDCPSSAYVSGGMPYYSFSATGLPLGLFIMPNGELSGTIPEEANEGTVIFNLCVKDEAFIETCKDVSMTVERGKAISVSPTAATYKLSLNAEYVRKGTDEYPTSDSATWAIEETEIPTRLTPDGGFYGTADVPITGNAL